MAQYKTREELFEAYMQVNSSVWKKWIMGLTVSPDELDYPLYHLTDNKADELNWISNRRVRSVVRISNDKPPDPIHSEPLPTRISTAPTLEGCFTGIYPYLCSLFKDKTMKQREFYLYEAIPDKHSRVLTPSVATDEWLIYDAHVTKEHCIFGRVKMVLVEVLVIKNPELVEDSKWAYSYPYGQKHYGNKIAIPPLVINKQTKVSEHISYEAYCPYLNDDLQFHVNQLETNMTINLKLNPSKELILSQLSLEAHTNPLQMVSEGLLTKFNLVITKLSNIDNSIQNLVAGSFNLDVTSNQIRRITESKTYMQLSVYGIGVPDGFIGPMTPYLNLLESTLAKYLDIRQDVLIPAVTNMGMMLADPHKLQSKTISPLAHIKFKTKEREYFNKHVNNYYSPKNQADNITFGRLFTSNGDFMEAAKVTECLTNLGKQANKVLDKIIEDVSTLKELTNRLAVRISQDNKTYGINASIANELAVIVTEVANEIAFFASLIVMCDQGIGVMDTAAAKVA